MGCVFLVRKSERVAKLRLLLVDPAARGLGLGHRLVAECVDFARACGYRSMTLWTNAILDAARHTYEAAGFVRTHTESRRAFGHDLVFETWKPRARQSSAGTGDQTRDRPEVTPTLNAATTQRAADLISLMSGGCSPAVVVAR